MCLLRGDVSTGAKDDRGGYEEYLFVCGGAFDGIEKKIAQRLNTRVVGYSASLGTATVTGIIY